MTPHPSARQVLTYVPLALVLPLLWMASEGKVAVKPAVWVAVTAVAAAGLRTAFGGGRARWPDWVLAGLLGLAATHLLLWPGFPKGHDTNPHLWSLYGFYRAILAGNLLPRWIHHVGLGMPLLLFYPPLPYYWMLPLLALGLPAYVASKYGLVLLSIASGLSMFYVVYRWTGDRRAALVAAGAYCFAPYHLLDSHYRVAVAEAAAMAVLPLFFFFAHQALEAPSRRRLGVAAAWTAVLTLTHPLCVLMAGTGLGLWVLARHRWRVGRPLLTSLALVGLLGLWGVGLAGYYTIPVVVEAKYTTLAWDLPGRGEEHPQYYWRGLRPDHLLARREWSELHEAPRRGSDAGQNEMPFYFGLTLLGLLPLARHPRIPKGLLAMTLGALALTLYPLDIVFARFPPMAMLQFPWRFLTIATFGACALAGFATLRALETAQGRWVERVIPGALFGLLVLDFFPYGGAPAWNEPYAGIYRLSAGESGRHSLPLRVNRLAFPPADSHSDLSMLRRLYPEYLTPESRRAYYHIQRDLQRPWLERAAVGLSFDTGWPEVLNARPYAEFTPAVGGPARGLAFTRAGEWIRVRLPGEAGTLVVKEQWFPGWEGQLGPAEVEVRKTGDGLMTFELHAQDAGELTLHFSRTRWDRLAGIVLSAVCLIGLLWPKMPQKRGC